LDGNYGKVELGASIRDKINENVGGVGFAFERKRPHKVREIINNDKVIFKARITENWRGP
jgi:hypothetical protein